MPTQTLLPQHIQYNDIFLSDIAKQVTIMCILMLKLKSRMEYLSSVETEDSVDPST